MNLLRLISARSCQFRPRRGPIRRRGISFEFLESRTLLSSGLNVGMNLGFIKPYATDDPFANVMEMAYPSWNVTSALRPAIAPPLTVPMPPLDGNGYPIGLGNLPAQGDAMYTEVFLQNGQHYPTGTYTLTFDGSGTVVINDSHDPIQTFTQGGGIGQPHNVTISGTAALGIVIAITSSNPSDYVRNIRLVMPGLQNTYQTQPFNPQYLSGLQSFSTLRFLDPMLPNITSSTTSNGQSGELTWSERTPPTYFTQAVSSGMSVEYMVDLCNALHENMWVTMPVNADNNYELNFAQYVEENLDPGLKVYVEYGNEIWNSTYSYEYNTVISYATAHGLNQPQAMADLSTNCWNVWLQVFAGQTDRMARVVASQFSVPWMFNEEIARLVATSRPTDPDHGFDVIAGGAYFSPDTSSFNAQTTVQQYEAAEMAALTGKFTQQLLNFTAMRNSWEAQLNQNIPVIMYEGGTGQSAHGSPPWYNTYVAAQTDPGQFAVIMAYLNELQDAGVTGVEYFNFIGLPSQWGEYGSMDYLGEPSNLTPKYNALVDFINSPSLAVTVSPAIATAGASSASPSRRWAPAKAASTRDIPGQSSSLAPTPMRFCRLRTPSPSPTRECIPSQSCFETTGTQSITVTDVANGLSRMATGIVVQPGAAHSFTVTGFPTTDTAGTGTSRDGYRLRRLWPPGDRLHRHGPVEHQHDVKADLPPRYTFTAKDAGVHTVSSSAAQVGRHTVDRGDGHLDFERHGHRFRDRRPAGGPHGPDRRRLPQPRHRRHNRHLHRRRGLRYPTAT